MEMFCIEDNDKVYRVRKEEEGCSIFGVGCFMEGDDITYNIIKAFGQNGVEKGYKMIKDEYQVEEEVLKGDLLEMFNELLNEHVLDGMARQIINYLSLLGRKNNVS